MITIEDLTKYYGQQAVVSDFEMNVGPGESVALWGPNGAGKTTVVRCILGLVDYEGSITVGGVNARNGKVVRSGIGYVPQELAFYSEMEVGELLAYSAELRKLNISRVEEVIETLGLQDHAHKQIRALSGGLKQRVGIASALLPDPSVLLLDEPTSNLDAEARDSVLRLLEDLRKEGRTLLVTSHHMEEVGMLVDRVIAMESGKKVIECAPTEMADALGLRAWLHIVTDNKESTALALSALGEAGIEARENSNGVLVEVSAQSKGTAISTLYEAGVHIADIEVWR